MQYARFRDPAGSVRSGRWDGGTIAAGGREYDADAVDVLPPTEPTKLVCVGLNYERHAAETGSDLPERPVLFMKGPNTVAGHGDTISLPATDARVDHEIELGVVIGQQCRSVAAGDAMDVVRGFTTVNDVSNRDEQWNEQNNVRGKSFDNAAPIGPTVATPDEVPADASLELRVNGEVRQDSDRSDLIFSVPEIIEEVTEYITLEPGDVVLTGTPEGVGPLSPGDTVALDVEGIPTLRHHVSE
jgi:2-keto-4-pentenoate hydratase/2-oxohepta-3-ene-1,7-dioic acid hydratase in catechol pathway